MQVWPWRKLRTRKLGGGILPSEKLQEVLKAVTKQVVPRASAVCLPYPPPPTTSRWRAARSSVASGQTWAGISEHWPLDRQPVSSLDSWFARHVHQAATVDKNPAIVQGPQSITNTTSTWSRNPTSSNPGGTSEGTYTQFLNGCQ